MSGKFVFSSDDLPEGLTEPARRSAWHDRYVETVGRCDLSFLADSPMQVRFEFAQAGGIGLGKYRGTMTSVSRTRAHVATNPPSVFHLTFNTGPAVLSSDIGQRQADLTPGQLLLFVPDRANTMRALDFNSWEGIQIPKQLLLERVPFAEDLACRNLPDTPATRMFCGYVAFLNREDGFVHDPALAAHVETTLLDLATLVLRSSGEAAEIARMRGLRAVRLQAIIGKIRAEFADAGLSSDRIARDLGLSRRYVNELLDESGQTLAERVLELRLQEARRMLADPRHDASRITDIAHACGFNDISYFNRRFRARFGCSPTQYRGGQG